MLHTFLPIRCIIDGQSNGGHVSYRRASLPKPNGDPSALQHDYTGGLNRNIFGFTLKFKHKFFEFNYISEVLGVFGPASLQYQQWQQWVDSIIGGAWGPWPRLLSTEVASSIGGAWGLWPRLPGRKCDGLSYCSSHLVQFCLAMIFLSSWSLGA